MDGDKIVSISLGANGVAEHEWGIKGLQEAFGVPGKPRRRRGLHRFFCGDLVGGDVRTATKVPRGLKFFENIGGYSWLFYGESFKEKRSWSLDELTREMFDRYDYVSKTDPTSSWSDKDFGIRISVPCNGSVLLREMYQAFQSKDIMLYEYQSSPDNPFRGGNNLVIAIRSRMQKEMMEMMTEADEGWLKSKILQG